MAQSKGNENVMGAVAYLLGFITGIILLLTEKQNRFIRFHAMQSTILFGGIFILHLVLGFIPGLGSMVGSLLSIVSIVLWIVCMWKAFKGEMFKLPVIGDFAEQQLKKI